MHKSGVSSWLLPFGTMMSLLLAVCVLLLSVSQVDKNRFAEAFGSVRGAFGAGEFVGGASRSAADPQGSMDFQQAILLVRLKEQLESLLAGMANVKGMDVVTVEEGFLVRLTQDLLFSSDSLTLRAEAKPILTRMATLFARVPNLIRIEAHTSDQAPAVNSPFASNWVLSAAVAATLADFFSREGGVDPVRLVVRGMGQHTPRDSNETPEGRARNRRIEILLTRELPVVPKTPSGTPPSAASGTPTVPVATSTPH
ncbi:MAG: OmpA family protein [Magnetococcales bacterium]|nr:OmpA family protein [Magnetococcales bacterium]